MQINLGFNQLSTIDENLFANAQKMAYIGLYSNQLRSIRAHRLLTSLFQLLMDDNKLSGVVSIGSNSMQLSTLSLSDNDIDVLDLSELSMSTALQQLSVRGNTKLTRIISPLEVLSLDISQTSMAPTDPDLCTSLGTLELRAQDVSNIPDWDQNIPAFLLRCFNRPPIVGYLLLSGQSVPLWSIRRALDRPYSVDVDNDTLYFPSYAPAGYDFPAVSVNKMPVFMLGSQALVQCTSVTSISSVYSDVSQRGEIFLDDFKGVVRAARYTCTCITGYVEDASENCVPVPPKPSFTQTPAGLAVIYLLSVATGVGLFYLVFLSARRAMRNFTGLKNANLRLQKKVEALKSTWKISASALEWGEPLGEGGYGEVCRAKFKVADIGDVAVKRLKSLDLDNHEVSQQLAAALEHEADFLIKVPWDEKGPGWENFRGERYGKICAQ